MARKNNECNNCGHRWRKLHGGRGYKGPKWIAHSTHNSRRRCPECSCPIPRDRDALWKLVNWITGKYDV